MKKKKLKKKEEGFIIVLAILLLLVMSLVGTTLVIIASNDYRGNISRDYNQQTLYAAEAGIQEAKRYLKEQNIKIGHNKEKVDQMSASLILRQFLSSS